MNFTNKHTITLDDGVIIQNIPNTKYYQQIAYKNSKGEMQEVIDSVAFNDKGEGLGEFRPFGEIGPNLNNTDFNYWRNTGKIKSPLEKWKEKREEIWNFIIKLNNRSLVTKCSNTSICGQKCATCHIRDKELKEAYKELEKIESSRPNY